jgi:hypothetical protein
MRVDRLVGLRWSLLRVASGWIAGLKPNFPFRSIDLGCSVGGVGELDVKANISPLTLESEVGVLLVGG